VPAQALTPAAISAEVPPRLDKTPSQCTSGNPSPLQASTSPVRSLSAPEYCAPAGKITG